MKKMRFVSALLACALLPGWLWAQEWISPGEAAAWLKQEGHHHIVDLRSDMEYLQGTIRGALHLTLEQLRHMQAEPDARLLIIPAGPDKPETLPAGYAEIRLLSGDRVAWKKAGLEIVKVRLVKPAFVIPRGLCEMNAPANTYDIETEQVEKKQPKKQ